MNGEDVKRALGVDPTLTFEACKADVSEDFALQADAMQNSALLLTDLVNEGVRLLVYAGNAGQPPHTTLETPLSNSNPVLLLVIEKKKKMRCAITWGTNVGSANFQMFITRSSWSRRENHGSRGDQSAGQAPFAQQEGGDQRLAMSRS